MSHEEIQAFPLASRRRWNGALISIAGAKSGPDEPSRARLQISTGDGAQTVTLAEGESVDIPGVGTIRLDGVDTEPPGERPRPAPGAGQVRLGLTPGDHGTS
ncbi:hypothetical protein [Brachybacterium sp. YJGR34]|uniref:hypothetical protein n=1 Tax=Brachybacterium sp. YJGR34 TaxID=2059911 RepID=UPI000E0C50F5|nr:hypothetical protein [Brachybacterium sp. YJGR34]